MRLFVNVYFPKHRNRVHETRQFAAEVVNARDLKECVEIEYDGTIENANRELADFTVDGLRAHYPLPDLGRDKGVDNTPFQPPLSLGYNSQTRKDTPLLATVFGYFAAAMAGLARHCVRSNDKHNKGEPVHWARGKSMDHSECSLRHLVDSAEMRAWLARNPDHPSREVVVTMLEHELDAKVWRAAAEAQAFYEEFRGAPLSFSSRLPA